MQEKTKQPIGNFPKETHLLDLLDKDFKSTTINTFKELKTNNQKERQTISEDPKGSMRMLSHQIEDMSKEKF